MRPKKRIKSVADVPKAELARLWATDLSRDEIAVALSISRSSLDRLARLAELPKKAPLSRQRRPIAPDEVTINLLAARTSEQWRKHKKKSRCIRKGTGSSVKDIAQAFGAD